MHTIKMRLSIQNEIPFASNISRRSPWPCHTSFILAEYIWLTLWKKPRHKARESLWRLWNALRSIQCVSNLYHHLHNVSLCYLYISPTNPGGPSSMNLEVSDDYVTSQRHPHQCLIPQILLHPNYHQIDLTSFLVAVGLLFWIISYHIHHCCSSPPPFD